MSVEIVVDRLLKDSLIGKKIVGLEYGVDHHRVNLIGKEITDVVFGFNDCREDAGIRILGKDCDEWCFIYANEGIEVV